ncbi:methanogen output domain 1-containing protein [Guptibacillus algicola]|uniref:methanogen output domain 1-containing protein n=1 Tax=Guptibacillus algicola TaxID=225844 RepID=UPI001CD3936E|nr:methanogen output domain 1-containing protein [Alkalihalobacillus algicola]MCA0988319.1 methanogen output domain 1-containing protein [Alkalihalobacillus algicola]
MTGKDPLSASNFLCKLITQYAHIHHRTIGSKAQEYITQLGIRTGEWFESHYQIADWTPDEYAKVIVDIKNSIGGEFFISEVTSTYVIVKANSCPFGEFVKDAPHLCKMTASVFGGIAARHFNYGEVNLRKRIALGDSGCEVLIAFEPGIEDGYKFENLKNIPDNSDPFTWEEDTITLLNEELKQSDAMVLTLLDELEDLKEQVNRS